MAVGTRLVAIEPLWWPRSPFGGCGDPFGGHRAPLVAVGTPLVAPLYGAEHTAMESGTPPWGWGHCGAEDTAMGLGTPLWDRGHCYGAGDITMGLGTLWG